MGFKSFFYAVICVLLIGVGVGSVGALFLLKPLKVAGVCAAFFMAGLFFAFFIHAWRKSRKTVESEDAVSTQH
ncbi:MAG TPA: hypothetical protein VGL38_09335 [bacterium]|jgi:4-amino-4-deoxy-L-arabinose transferase-like glycosyltransferase